MVFYRRHGMPDFQTNAWGLEGIEEAAKKCVAGEIDVSVFRHILANELLDDSGMDLDESGDTLKLVQWIASGPTHNGACDVCGAVGDGSLRDK